MTPEDRHQTVYRLLKEGVPPTAIAHALDMDPDTVHGALNHMRAESYGTDEIGEAMTFLIWEAYDEMRYQIRHGTPANKFKTLQMVLARSIALAGRQSPELAGKVHAALSEITAASRTPNVQLQESIYTPVD